MIAEGWGSRPAAWQLLLVAADMLFVGQRLLTITKC
jgi:hypothetical protein